MNSDSLPEVTIAGPEVNDAQAPKVYSTRNVGGFPASKHVERFFVAIKFARVLKAI